MEILEYIVEGGYIVAIALWVLGSFIKSVDAINSQLIPIILLAVSLGFTPLVIGGYSPDNVVQAVLIAGLAVFGNELIKQTIRGTAQLKGDE